jgi:hypothetical protein
MRPLRFRLLAALALAVVLSASLRPAPARAQAPASVPTSVPGHTLAQAGGPGQYVVAVSSAFARQSPDSASAPVFSVFRGEVYTIAGRTADGSWLLIQPSADLAGWLPRAYGAIDGEPLPTPDPRRLPAVPAGVIPSGLSAAAREYYAYGLALGRNPAAFSKLGDCNTENGRFLVMFDPPTDYRLGARYSYLQRTVDHFQGSFARESLAAKSGFSAASLLDPIWADPAVCQAGETPLACELRVNNPSLALVMLGTHAPTSAAAFETSLRQLLDATLAEGVLPILATKADNVEGDDRVNAVIRAVAADYELPLWDFWAAVQPLPAGGLASDGIHFTYGRSYFDDDWALTRGWTWRNLTALLTLDSVLSAVTPDPGLRFSDRR